ncbi:MAG: ABC transporter ATP-binding protein, partial [Longimicrobiales bacterium]
MRKLFRYFWQHYRMRTSAVVALLWLAALLDFVSLSSLLPLLHILTGAPGSPGLARLPGWFPTTVPALLAFIAALLLVKALLRWLAMRQVANAVVAVAHELRTELHAAMMAASWSFFVQTPAAHLATAVASEAYRAAFGYRRACAVLAAFLQLAFTVVLVAVISAWVGLTALLIGGAITFLLRSIVRNSRTAGVAQTESTRALSARVADTAHTIKPARAMGRQAALGRALDDASRSLRNAESAQLHANEILISAREPVIALAVALTLFGAYSIAGRSAAELLVLGLLFYRVLQQVNVIQLEYQGLVWDEAAFRAMRAQIESARARPERPGMAPGESDAPGMSWRELQLADVTFGYERGYDRERVLERISLTVPFGALVLITGPSGAGKTTLLDIVAGLYSPWSGQVLVDGMPLQEKDLHAWRRQIGYMTQEPALLHASVQDNLMLGEDIPHQALQSALRCARAAEFVATLPDGLDTLVGEHGYRLSGGQRQRLALARALVHEPGLLLLDEPTANVDPATQDAIVAALAELRGNRTILLVSHQPAFRQIADYVMELEPNMTSALATSSA